MKFLYLIQASDKSLFKIGISKYPKKRLKQLQTASAYELKIVFLFETKHASKLEKTLHRIYSINKKIDEDNQAIGEWFFFTEKEFNGFEEKCMSAIKTFDLLESLNNKF